MFGALAALDRLRSATPGPTTPPGFDEDSVTPGPWGFVIFAAIAIVVVLLIIDMTRRVRRLRYREEIRERLAAEVAERDGGAPDADAQRDAPDAVVREPDSR